jgi:hypothetical protein
LQLVFLPTSHLAGTNPPVVTSGKV